ncbi:16552_t:CDS:2, partial [Racocetra persica]
NNARVVFGAGVAVRKDNFETIISDCLTFVNKSMLVKEFIESLDFYITNKDLSTGIWDKMIEKLRTLVAEIYDEHHYLISSLYPKDQKIFQRILKRDPTYPELQLEFFLKALSKHLR